MKNAYRYIDIYKFVGVGKYHNWWNKFLKFTFSTQQTFIDDYIA